MANYFDRFEVGPNDDLTKPLGGMDRPQTRAALDRAAAPPPPAAAAAANYFDRFEGSAPATPEPEQGVFGRLLGDTSAGRLKQSLATGVGDVVEGVGDIAGLVTNPAATILNRTGLPQWLGAGALPEDTGAAWREGLGLPRGATPTERIVGEGISAATGGLAGAGLAGGLARGLAPGIARTVAGEVAATPGLDTLSGAASGVASQSAQEADLPVWAQIGAGLAGGVGGYVGGAALRNGFRARPNIDVPNEELIAGALDPQQAQLPAPPQMLALPAPAASTDVIPLGDGIPRLPAPPPQLMDMRGELAPPANSNRPAPIGTPNRAETPDVIAGGMDESQAQALDRGLAMLRDLMAKQSDGGGVLSSRVPRLPDQAPRAANDMPDLPAVPDRPRIDPLPPMANPVAPKAAPGRPASDARGITQQLFPEARITSSVRSADDPLTKANPRSWHARSHAAVDVAPIKGMQFDQFVQRYRDAGHSIIEAKNEVGAGRSKHATGDHWHVVIGEKADGAPGVAPAPIEPRPVEPISAPPRIDPPTDAAPEPIRAPAPVPADEPALFDAPPRPVEPEPQLRTVTGDPEQVVTARGRPVDTQFEVREARDLVSSSDPSFDQALQPRDRASRSSSDAQIAEISSRMDPEQLNTSRQAAQGAPIIGPDRMVESGNGRVSAIRRAYELHPERAAEYRAMIERRGMSTEGFDQPVLVRRRLTEMAPEDRVGFVREANERDTMGMSSTEQAKVDAGTLSTDTLGLYRGGSITDAGNRDFVRGWMDTVASPAERNTLIQPDGTLSADGVRRLRTSLLAKAFDNSDLVAKVVEDPDTEIRAIGNTLTEAAPAFAKLRERVASGELPAEYDITGQVADAANKVATARQLGRKIGDEFRQDDIFAGRVDPVTESVARLMFKDDAMTKPRSAADMAEGLRFYTDEAAKHSDTDMFGGGASASRAAEVLDTARARLDAKAAAKVQERGLFQAQRSEEGYKPSSYERDFEAAVKGKDVHAVVDHIARTAPTVAYQRIASRVGATLRRMEAQGHSFKFDVVNEGEMAPRSINTAKGMVITRAHEEGLTHNRIYLRGTDLGRAAGTQHETALHEMIHAATMSTFDANRAGRATPRQAAAVKDLQGTFDHVADEFNKAARSKQLSEFQQRYFERRNNSYANPEELLAWGLTNRGMQDELERIKMPGAGKRTAFSAFVSGVRRLLGLGPADDTALARVLRAADGLLDDEADTIPAPPMPDTSAATGAAGEQGRFAFSLDGDGPARSRSWGKIADMVFDPEFRSGDSAALAGSIKRLVGDPKAAIASTGTHLRQFGEAVAYSTDSAIRSMGARFNSPTLGKMADLFHAPAGVTDKATTRTFGEAVTRNRGRFLSRLDEALQPHRSNDAGMGRIRDLLAEPTKTLRATAPEREAAGKLRDLLAEVLEYRRDAGEAIGEVKDGYFPRQMRQDRVFADPDKFLRAAEAAYRQIGADDPAAAAAAYLQRNIDGHLGIADGVGGGSPGASSAKVREFGKAADEHLRDFYDTNPLSALTTYVSGAVKRAEETRRFGIKGRENSPERLAWKKEHGDQTQWAVMKAQIQDELRENGQREPGIMDRIEALRTNSLGKQRMGSPRTGAAVSVIHAWNQLSTLGRAMVASVPEVAMGFVRAGPRLGFTHLNTTLNEFVRNVRGLPASEATRYAEAAGAIGSDNSLHLLRARADDVTANAATSKILDQFYRKNGLEAWTRAGRTAAVKTGQRFVGVLADDMATGSPRAKSRAAGYLRELGVQDPETFAAAVRSDTPTVADLAGDSGHAAQYATALLRFADQTVLMPNRSVKPRWASHPVGSLVFALQSYNYTFKKQVLDRVGRETVAGIRERDPEKLAAAAGMVALVGTTAAVQGLRHAIWGSPVNADDETPMHYALETLDRSGMFGAASPIFNAFQGLKYQRTVGQSLQGSVLGRASDAADAVGTLVTNNTDSDAAERKAAGAFYDMVISPAESAIGASVLRGAAGSAVILGHGVRNDNGLLPADRAAFVDTAGGPAPERKGDGE